MTNCITDTRPCFIDAYNKMRRDMQTYCMPGDAPFELAEAEQEELAALIGDGYTPAEALAYMKDIHRWSGALLDASCSGPLPWLLLCVFDKKSTPTRAKLLAAAVACRQERFADPVPDGSLRGLKEGLRNALNRLVADRHILKENDGVLVYDFEAHRAEKEAS